jgi:hypothetical protein
MKRIIAASLGLLLLAGVVVTDSAAGAGQAADQAQQNRNQNRNSNGNSRANNDGALAPYSAKAGGIGAA